MTCVLTVDELMNSRSPISGPERPSAISASTCDSRSVSSGRALLIALAQLSDEAGLDLLGEHGLALRDRLDRVADLVERRRLGQESGDAELDHVVDEPARAVGRQHQDPRRESLPDDRPDDLDAVERRQAAVEQRDGRQQLADLLERRVTVPRGSDELEVRAARQPPERPPPEIRGDLRRCRRLSALDRACDDRRESSRTSPHWGMPPRP